MSDPTQNPIYLATLAALAPADDLGGVEDPSAYIELMRAIAAECSRRADVAARDSNPDLSWEDFTPEEKVTFAHMDPGPVRVDMCLHSRWMHGLIDDQILAIEADSCVGAAVVGMCKRADALLDFQPEDGDGEDCHEDAFVGAICEAVSDQANVWYFG